MRQDENIMYDMRVLGQVIPAVDNLSAKWFHKRMIFIHLLFVDLDSIFSFVGGLLCNRLILCIVR